VPWVNVTNIKGPPGDPGPTAVSSDSGNVAALGSDDLVFVSGRDLPRIKFVTVPPHPAYP
jgi:hypothetical protein